MDAAQELARKRRLVSAARALITQESGFSFGARRIWKALHHLGDEYTRQFPVFNEFLQAIPTATPLGELRLLCTEEFLLQSDAVLAKVELKFRALLLEECHAVIAAYGKDEGAEGANAS